MAVSSHFNPGNGERTTTGDNLENTIMANRDAAGSILINTGALPIQGGAATVTNAGLIQAFVQDGKDTIPLDETSGALPSAKMFGGAGQQCGHWWLGRGPALRRGRQRCTKWRYRGDTMMGSVGNDAYIVDNADDGVVENAGEGDDTVFTSVNYGLTANVEILVMQGAAPACGASAIRAQFDLRHYPQ